MEPWEIWATFPATIILLLVVTGPTHRSAVVVLVVLIAAALTGLIAVSYRIARARFHESLDQALDHEGA